MTTHTMILALSIAMAGCYAATPSEVVYTTSPDSMPVDVHADAGDAASDVVVAPDAAVDAMTIPLLADASDMYPDGYTLGSVACPGQTDANAGSTTISYACDHQRKLVCADSGWLASLICP